MAASTETLVGLPHMHQSAFRPSRCCDAVLPPAKSANLRRGLRSLPIPMGIKSGPLGLASRHHNFPCLFSSRGSTQEPTIARAPNDPDWRNLGDRNALQLRWILSPASQLQ